MVCSAQVNTLSVKFPCKVHSQWVLMDWIFPAVSVKDKCVFPSAGRPLFQACVCLERYLGVVHPVTYLRSEIQQTHIQPYQNSIQQLKVYKLPFPVFLRYSSVRTRLCALPPVWGLTLFFCVCIIWKLVFAFPILFLLLLLLQGFCCVRILQVSLLEKPHHCRCTRWNWKLEFTCWTLWTFEHFKAVKVTFVYKTVLKCRSSINTKRSHALFMCFCF